MTSLSNKLQDMRFLFLFIFYLLLLNVSISQISYMYEITPSFFIPSIEVDADNDLGGSYFLYAPFALGESFIAVTKLSETGSVVDAHKLSVQNLTADAAFFIDYVRRGDKHFCMAYFSPIDIDTSFLGVILYNSAQDTAWGLNIDGVASSVGQSAIAGVHGTFSTDDRIVFSVPVVDSMAFSLLSYNIVDFSMVWNYHFHCPSAQKRLYNIDEEYFSPSGDISVLLSEGHQFFIIEDGDTTRIYLLRLSLDGDIILSCRLSGVNILPVEHVTTSDGSVYLALRKKREGIPDQYDAFICKLDSGYNVLWAKKLLVDKYSCLNMELKPLLNGGLAFALVSYDNLPTIYGELNAEGDLLWYQGYSFYNPAISINDDGTICFASTRKYYENGSFTQGTIIAKSDSVGNIAGCPQYAVCLEVISESLQVDLNLPWVQSPIFKSYENVPIEVEDFNISLTPYCGSPTPPHPYFYLPDTICAGDCLTPDSTYNRLAHQVEWYITGPGGLDTTIIDTTFTWCFDEPGHYQVEQGIWLLGCSDYFLRDVVVLPDDLAPALGEDRVLCEQPPYSLSANASRPLTSYLWNNGSTAAELEVTSSGTYWLEASDGYCILRDTVQLTFLDDLLTQGPALSLPADTAVCEQHLPYALLPQSPYVEGFSVPAISNSSASSFKLWQAGSYEVQAEVFGCPIRDTFALEVNDCHSRIYFPTAFSPNGDGLNDLFLPQGKDYEGIELQVYDRWGGLLFSSQSPPFAWDGADAAGGVYVYRFRYWNSLALQEEEISGQVVLLR